MKNYQRIINGQVWIKDKAGAPYNIIMTYENGWEYSIVYSVNNPTDIQKEIDKIIESVKLEEKNNIQSNNNENIETENNIQLGDNIPIEDIIEKFLNICATQQIPEAMLGEIGYNYIYNSERKSKEINGKTYYDSGIKYSEAKARLLSYMTEDLFDEMLAPNYKNIDGNLYCYRGDYVECTYTDTSAKYIASNGDVDKYLIITTCNFSNGIFDPVELEFDIINRSVAKWKQNGILKDDFGITSIEKHSERPDDYIITGYALEKEPRKVSLEEFKNVKNGEKIDFRGETWQLQNVQSNERLTLVSDSGKKIALVMQDDGYACFASIAGAEGFCADYSDAKIKISLHKNADIKFWGGDDGITMEEFATRNYKSRSGKYAEYTPIIENNEIVGFRYFSD